MSRKRTFFERLTGSVPVTLDDNNLTPAQRQATEVTDNWQGENEEGELAVDVYQTPSEIVIQTMVSGVKPEDLQISITREMVTIRGKREFTREVSQSDYFQRELYWGSFSRSVLLPSEIEVEEAEALEKHGLLTIRLPKVDKNREQHLKVKSL